MEVKWLIVVNQSSVVTIYVKAIEERLDIGCQSTDEYLYKCVSIQPTGVTCSDIQLRIYNIRVISNIILFSHQLKAYTTAMWGKMFILKLQCPR